MQSKEPVLTIILEIYDELAAAQIHDAILEDYLDDPDVVIGFQGRITQHFNHTLPQAGQSQD
jgi:hypothetical protein